MTSYPTLRQGSKGSTVVFLQKNLISLGYGSTLSPEGADGVFGSKTTRAVRDFQMKNALTVDGVVGTNTWNKIISLAPPENVLVNMIQSTSQSIPSIPIPKPPTSLPRPELPSQIQIATKTEGEKDNTMLYGLLVIGGFWLLTKSKPKRK
jgi:peptidoglycan hydrolase-like protein with peptidoglycan-binding domain